MSLLPRTTLYSGGEQLLLDNRFIRAVPRAFENQPESTCGFLNLPNIFPI
jgi:hypothetical protein